MAWTAATILGPVPAPPAGPKTPAQRERERIKSQTLNDPSLGGFGPTPTRPGMQQVGSSMPVPGGSSMPSFLNNPSGVLADALIPYEEILSRIFAPPAGPPGIPPALARAYAAQANANAARTQQQLAATQAAAALPGRLMESRARARELGNWWSLQGLPTGLGYQDPLRNLQNQSFDIQAMMLGAPRSSGWTPSFPMY